MNGIGTSEPVVGQPLERGLHERINGWRDMRATVPGTMAVDTRGSVVFNRWAMVPPRPSDATLDALHRVVAPWRWWTDARFTGLHRVPAERPLVFVGNHTIFGLYDLPLLYLEIWRRHRLFLHGLGDHIHFKVPGWAQAVRYFGAVPGSRDNGRRLLAARESLLVFPGGGREVARRRDDKYRLHWKRRSGFARLAVEFGATIVPFAMVGAEDAWDVVLDADDYLRGPAGWLVDRLGVRREILWPVVRGFGPTPLPRPARFRFHVGEPLTTRGLAGCHQDHDACFALREDVRRSVEASIRHLRSSAL